VGLLSFLKLTLLKGNWNGKDDNGKSAASGVYFCPVEMPGHSYTKKMILLK
jgi:hypothetical protein